MNNIKINSAETVFEPFWDSGESYPEHEKYSRLAPYTIQAGSHSGASVFWAGVRISVGAGETLSMKRECALKIAGYDIFRMFASVSDRLEITVCCRIDGKNTEIMHVCGKGVADEYDGSIRGKMIYGIELRFRNPSDASADATLSWLGLSNAKLQKEMEAEASGFLSDWEGCFEASLQEAEPVLGIFFDKQGLEEIRKKVKKEPYASIFAELKKRAEEHMEEEPERYIGELAPYVNRSFVRRRDRERPEYCKYMEDIAFVGLVEGDTKKLRMACRMALSLACCRVWCESVMGDLPGTTWHHRSFTEERIGVACMKVLDWAGSLLTWHGRNLIFDAVIMKALPRLDADLKTVDYIWYMNQGVFFAGGLVAILAGLSKRYPRYRKRLWEAEKDLIRIWKNYVAEDGGCAEGPAYWGDSFRSMIISMYILARSHGKTLREYIPDIIKKSEDYALCMLSGTGNGCSFLPLNDTRGEGTYHPIIPAFFARVSDKALWRKMFSETAKDSRLPYGAELLMLSDMSESEGAKAEEAEFLSLNTVGHTMLKRKSDRLGETHLHLTGGGLVTFGHSHADKGSFLLEAGGVPIFIDCGVSDYSSADVKEYAKPQMHNLLIPDIEGATQNLDKCGKIGKILCSEYQNGVFRYAVDLKTAWQTGIFKKNLRTVQSSAPERFTVTDEVAYREPTASVWNLNTYGEVTETGDGFLVTCEGIKATITPKNWRPVRFFVSESADGRGRRVNRLSLCSEQALSLKLVTEIEVI